MNGFCLTAGIAALSAIAASAATQGETAFKGLPRSPAAGHAIDSAERAVRLRPDGTNDMTTTVNAAVETVRAAGGGTIECERGDYHFAAGSVTRLPGYFISNHDPIDPLPVHIPLVGLTNVTIRGNGSTFICHGGTIACAIIECDNVRLEGVGFDWSRPFITELAVRGYENGKTLVSIDRGVFPFSISNGNFIAMFDGGFSTPVERTQAFSAKDNAIVARTRDFRNCGRVARENPDGTLLLETDFSRSGVRPGDFIAFRPMLRPCPEIFGYRSRDIVLEDVAIHTGWGIGGMFQRCENVTWRGTGRAEDRRAGVFARKGSGHFTTLHADASHFSNVKGRVLVENALFEGMMDDAINVHSTCPAIAEVVSPTRIRCRCMREDGMGFDLFKPGETLRFVKGKTFEAGPVAKVAAVRQVSAAELVIDLEAAVPSGYAAGDVVENADWQPSVVFRGCIVGRNRARGSLFTTSKPVLVESNLFERVQGSAILFAGDAQLWYESGSCRNVLVRGNTFRNCLTTKGGDCKAVISICPRVVDVAAQRIRVHQGITVEDNVFETFDAPLLYAYSASNVVFRHNEIRRNSDFPPYGEPLFVAEHSEDVRVEREGRESQPQKLYSAEKHIGSGRCGKRRAD